MAPSQKLQIKIKYHWPFPEKHGNKWSGSQQIEACSLRDLFQATLYDVPELEIKRPCEFLKKNSIFGEFCSSLMINYLRIRQGLILREQFIVSYSVNCFSQVSSRTGSRKTCFHFPPRVTTSNFNFFKLLLPYLGRTNFHKWREKKIVELSRCLCPLTLER